MSGVRLRPAWSVLVLLASLAGAVGGAVAPGTPVASGFYTLTPCRLVDTRLPDGPLAGPALAAGAVRAFDLTEASCGVPAGASAVSLNVTAVAAMARGSLTLYPGTGPVPVANSLSFGASSARANNAVVGLVAGTLSVASLQSSGTVHLVLDVNGYFAPSPTPTPTPTPTRTATPTPTLTPTPTPTPTTTPTLTPTPTPTSPPPTPPPVILDPPASLTVDVGVVPSFAVTASGTGPLSYQWWKDKAPIPGATSSVYEAPAAAFADTGALFSVVVTDAWGGSATSAPATLTVRADLATWLSLNPNVAAAMRWQFQPADMVTYNSYAPPGDKDKIAWADWSQAQKDDLNQAYLDARAWLAQGAPQAAMPIGGLTDEPANQNSQTSIDSLTPSEWVTPAYMWKLYVAHVALSLALETTGTLPWSLVGDTDETLRQLFDSSVMAWYVPNGNYVMGTYRVPALRADNRPQTAFAPPMWTYPFLKQAGLVGTTRLETIGNVLQWMRLDLWHFFGSANYGTYDAVWQYRGWVPLSKIVSGTVDANNPVYGVQHWTAGCHGSVAFLHQVLRALNVPVQPVWVAGHELAYFTSERLYLDHGDDPYNQVVKSHPSSPILSLLIDESTYKARFTADLTVNITDPYSPALANVGREAANFH